MGSVRVNPETNKLFLDFRYRGHRCREYTNLNMTKTNEKRLGKLIQKIDAEIAEGSFDYAAYFPDSKHLRKFVSKQPLNHVNQAHITNADQDVSGHPTFNGFADTWILENEISWRASHRKNQHSMIDGHLRPVFGEKVVSRITKADILAFRSVLAKEPGRNGKLLSPKRINAILTPLRQILNEAADRFEFNTPFRNIKPLKVPKTHVEPFSLEQVQMILSKVRADYKPYYTVRFLTGMRTGEIDGLKWQYVDLQRRQILIRETRVNGETEYTKTDGSQREIQMSLPVYEALKQQEKITRKRSAYVFCNREGQPLDHTNVTKRVWYPLLRHLGLEARRPYQTRHTAATLWLASGESPEWIARQMGHTSTEMLFRVYSRYVPNLTRQDGSAFERLLISKQVADFDQTKETIDQITGGQHARSR